MYILYNTDTWWAVRNKQLETSVKYIESQCKAMAGLPNENMKKAMLLSVNFVKL